MKFKLLNDQVKLPELKHEGDAGYDLYLYEPVMIQPNTITVINTGIAVEIPKGEVGIIVPRSSIATSCQFQLQMPLIDSNYRGEIHIIVNNPTNYYYEFNKNDRICSLCVFKIDDSKPEEIKELSQTERGANWNGSTGK